MSLAEARAVAFDYRKTTRNVGDPVALRSGGLPTFTQAAETVIPLLTTGWPPSIPDPTEACRSHTAARRYLPGVHLLGLWLVL